MGITKNKPGLWVWAFDLHFPHQNKGTFNAMLDFITRNKLAGFGWGGDQFSNDEISRHTKGKHLLREPGAYQRNTRLFRLQRPDTN